MNSQLLIYFDRGSSFYLKTVPYQIMGHYYISSFTAVCYVSPAGYSLAALHQICTYTIGGMIEY